MPSGILVPYCSFALLVRFISCANQTARWSGPISSTRKFFIAWMISP